LPLDGFFVQLFYVAPQFLNVFFGKSVVKGSRIRVEKLKEVAHDILSIKVSAIKPQETT
jgi:hypothetical protein